MAKKKTGSFRADLARAAMLLGFSALLGLTVNALSSRSFPVYPSDEPGLLAPDPVGHHPTCRSVPPNRARKIWRTSRSTTLIRAQRNPAETVRIVDVRGEAEFDVGHIPTAIHATYQTIMAARQGTRCQPAGVRR